MTNNPAILGGDPVFAKELSLVRPLLPDFDELALQIHDILDTGIVTKGAFLLAFEEAIAAHLGVKHAIAVSSCTSGLMLTYQGLGLAGDVVVPSFTFMATVGSLQWVGIRPVFADVHPGTTNLDPVAAEAAITPETTAIVAVHNFGNPAEIDALQQLATRYGLRLIFDAAHGFGSLYRGTPVGAKGDAHVFSLSPTKLLIAGEGGIVATNDSDLAEKIRIGREYGNSGDYDSQVAGLNARMPEFNALLGLHSLGNLEKAVCHRNKIAALYRQQLHSTPGIGFQEIHADDRSSYKDFSITVDHEAFGLTRNELAAALAYENIASRKYYCPAVHQQGAYRQFAPSDETLPSTIILASRSLSLPIWSDMDEAIAEDIAWAIQRIHRSVVRVRMALTRRHPDLK